MRVTVVNYSTNMLQYGFKFRNCEFLGTFKTTGTFKVTYILTTR